MFFSLSLADSEHLSAAFRAGALSCRLAIFQGDLLGAFDFFLGMAFNTITLKLVRARFCGRTSFLVLLDMQGTPLVQCKR